MNAIRYDLATGNWQIGVALERIPHSGNPYSVTPTLTVDAAGNAMAFWTRYIGDQEYHLFSASYSSASRTWSTATTLSMPGGSVAVGPSGEVLALWGQDTGSGVLNPYWALYAGE